ncbi:hypothetical protein G6011_01082 [Alternaria panax]|uniref:Wings apart-like protein C-terminal domain-containing protein n=1 Tax=Alternaria panax TaxID=48097 RepID=A0AAD4IKC9_9PLEO|nr:hypothetical protein G6011_01082 [Alternaria panax]
MATTMFANFTSSDRRKRVYGKASRHSALPPPFPDANDDAPPSPERPRKHAAASNASLNRAGSALDAGLSLGNARAKIDEVDIFDVPSEDEFLSRPKPAKKIIAKRRVLEAGLEPSTSFKDEASREPKKATKAAQLLRKPDDVKPTAGKKTLPPPAQIPKSVQAPLPSSSNPAVPRTLRGMTPQPVEAPKQTIRDHKSLQRPVAKAKAPAEVTVPAPHQTKAQKNVKTALAPPAKKVPGKAPAKPADDLAVFDVPMSDEEAPPTVKKISRQAQSAGPKEAAKKSKRTPEESHKDTAESDDSNASKKRKRQGSVSSTATITRPVVQNKREQSVPQRSRKYQKNEDGASPGHGSSDQRIASSIQKVQLPAPVINKPTRTRQRTVPVLAPRTITKGQSSPAMLNGMIPSRQPSKPSPVKEVFEVAELEDQTMYDIPDPLTTPVRKSKASMPGSVTPRQKDLFGGLLSDSSSSTTPMPSISNLQLTDCKPQSLIGSLARSKSDVTHSAKARKTRLIDTLKPSEPSSDDYEEGSSEAGDDSEASSNYSWTARESLLESRNVHHTMALSDNMDVDSQAKVDSQTSQTTSGFGMRPKLTYAMARSYLKEDNPEDDLLISMDLDDGFGSQSQRETRSVSESDAEQNSQAQAQQIHELRTRGRNTVLQHEAEMMIEETSTTTSKNIRRSAMIDLCTKMADEKFCDQLLDSTLAHQFFQNISVGGEIIFEFVAAVATVFVLRTNPASSVLDQLHETGSLTNLIKLANNDADIKEIAKDRKTNLSKIAKESVLSFRTLVQQSSVWSPAVAEKVSPRLVALKAIELLIVGLRKAGNVDMLLNQKMISQTAEIASDSNDRLESNNGGSEDNSTLEMVLSILESTSATRQIQATWPTGVLQRIAKFVPRFFQPDAASSTMLAVKLCMNLTNNKPKACLPFSAKAFVQPLMQSIIEKFRSINAGLALEKRTEILDSLVLSLGAAINLAELSDQMRLNATDEIDTLVEIFIEGMKRASQAASVEESHSGVAIGYLGVLLGNLSLNDIIRTKVRTLLPNKRLDTLVDSIKDFVRVHQHVDQKSEDFEGAEGQEALQTYTARLMLVVERLQNASS